MELLHAPQANSAEGVLRAECHLAVLPVSVSCQREAQHRNPSRDVGKELSPPKPVAACAWPSCEFEHAPCGPPMRGRRQIELQRMARRIPTETKIQEPSPSSPTPPVGGVNCGKWCRGKTEMAVLSLERPQQAQRVLGSGYE